MLFTRNRGPKTFLLDRHCSFCIKAFKALVYDLFIHLIILPDLNAYDSSDC